MNNHKQTILAHLPLAVYLDLEVQIKAPKRLIKAGIGDSICISTCKFDWLMSHLIFNSSYNEVPFELVKSRHKKLITQNYDLSDKNFIKLLSEILVISGIGMYLSNGSYPASQGEHLIAHYLEMNYANLVKKYFHGEQIAVTTLTMAEIQEKILKINSLQIKQYQINRALKSVQKKSFTEKEIFIINQNLKQNWPKIKKQLQAVFISKNDLLKLYRKFHLPSKPINIGVKSNIYREAVNNAHLIRDRFTSLDILCLQL
jgi:glycerol-1-phosphate dehydrogenase [NAD(P)+]